MHDGGAGSSDPAPRLFATVVAMPMTSIDFLSRRGLAPVAAGVLAGCLLAAGCGGSSAPRKFPGGIRPVGPADLGANLKGLMSHAQPELKDVKMACPTKPITHFPVICRFTATQVAPFAKSKKGFPGPYRVAGTASVFGVYFRTRTYEYSLNFAPTH